MNQTARVAAQNKETTNFGKVRAESERFDTIEMECPYPRRKTLIGLTPPSLNTLNKFYDDDSEPPPTYIRVEKFTRKKAR